MNTGTQLVKRRSALLESNRPRNSQLETRSDAGLEAAFGSLPALRFVFLGKDFLMPSKTHADALTLTVGSDKERSNSTGGR